MIILAFHFLEIPYWHSYTMPCLFQFLLKVGSFMPFERVDLASFFAFRDDCGIGDIVDVVGEMGAVADAWAFGEVHPTYWLNQQPVYFVRQERSIEKRQIRFLGRGQEFCTVGTGDSSTSAGRLRRREQGWSEYLARCYQRGVSPFAVWFRHFIVFPRAPQSRFAPNNLLVNQRAYLFRMWKSTQLGPNFIPSEHVFDLNLHWIKAQLCQMVLGNLALLFAGGLTFCASPKLYFLF